MKCYTFFVGTCVEAQSITISTNPTLPSENFVATNYVDLQLIATILGSPISCDFRTNDQDSVIFYGNNGCLDISSLDYSTDCNEDDSLVTFFYTVNAPLSTQLNYVVSCFLPMQVAAQITIQVKGINNL